MPVPAVEKVTEEEAEAVDDMGVAGTEMAGARDFAFVMVDV